jgi:hypothetical protein
MFIQKAKDLGALGAEDINSRTAELGEKLQSAHLMGIVVAVGAAVAFTIATTIASPVVLLATVVGGLGFALGKVIHDGECRAEKARLRAVVETRERQQGLGWMSAASTGPASAPAPAATPAAAPVNSPLSTGPTKVMAPLQLKRGPSSGP